MNLTNQPDYVAINERGEVVRSFSHEDLAEKYCLAMADRGASLTVVPRIVPAAIWRDAGRAAA